MKKNETNKNLSYQKAGVNIESGNKVVDNIKPHAKKTSRSGADINLGSFGGIFDIAACNYNDPVLVAATDGVGTKLKIAFELEQHETIGIDLVAMCVNDLIVQGAEPLFFLDYFATGKLDIETATSVIKGISDGCKIANCALIGGETAEMPGMYNNSHYDLAGFAVGAVERKKILPDTNIKEGDTLLGLASSGIHSNGYSLVRYLINQQNLSLHDPAPFNKKVSLGETILTPTRIYVKSCLNTIKKEKIKGLAHITGGGFTENIPRILPQTLSAAIDCTKWQTPDLFLWLQKNGNIDTNEMLKTFNCGIGMVAICDQERAIEAKKALEEEGETVYEIGTITKRHEQPIEYSNLENFNDQ